VLGLLLSRNPSLTRDQLLGAVLRTARRVPGVVHGRIDPVAAFDYLGLLPKTSAPAAPPPPTTATRTVTPAPAQRGPRFTRQTLFETGSFKRGFKATFTVGRGRFELQLLTPQISACALSLTSASEVILAAPAVKNLLSLAVSVDAGRYTAAVRCRGARSREYSLGVIAMFPRLP
jgi:hypothetical protein